MENPFVYGEVVLAGGEIGNEPVQFDDPSRLPPELADLARRRVILDLPKRYY